LIFNISRKKYDESHPEEIIDINIDGYEQVERHFVYYNENNLLETHKIGFRKQNVLNNEYLRFPETGKEVGIERYNYETKIPSYLNDENKDVCIIPILNKRGLTGELLRISKTRK
jgi:hypothetical protein